jgi:hypothetical protein
VYVTKVTRWAIKLGVSADETQTACGSVVRVILFQKKFTL